MRNGRLRIFQDVITQTLSYPRVGFFHASFIVYTRVERVLTDRPIYVRPLPPPSEPGRYDRFEILRGRTYCYARGCIERRFSEIPISEGRNRIKRFDNIDNSAGISAFYYYYHGSGGRPRGGLTVGPTTKQTLAHGYRVRTWMYADG